MRKWLITQKVTGLWIKEFQQRGAVHLHILINNRIDLEKVGEKWHKITGSDDKSHIIAGCQISKIRSRARLSSYLVNSNKDQHIVPENFGSVGRFWGLFGGAKSHQCTNQW